MPRCFRRLVAVALLVPSVAAAQGLRERVRELFSFGDCGEPLCLPSLVLQNNVHGRHYIPAAEASGALVLDFLTQAIGNALTNVPISATSSGVTFSFVGGAPQKSTVSSGPIFAERAQTLGSGRMLLGANVSSLRFRSLRGVPLNGLQFTALHENSQVPNEIGNPVFENDLLDVTMALQLNTIVTSAFFTYGITDRIDVGVAVPFVVTNLEGRSRAEITPFGGTAVHFFGGTAQNPELSAIATTSGSAAGIGDVAARVKVNLGPTSGAVGFAVLGDIRLPTGSEEELLGTGEVSSRAYAVLSGKMGNFSPHLNFGTAIRTGVNQNNAMLATGGFDHLLSPSFTLAFDVITEWQMGDANLKLPQPVTFTQPYRRTVSLTNIPDVKDNLFSGSIGIKYAAKNGLTTVVNGLAPLNRGGLRPWSILTFGLERSF
ncbi:MAG: hypothetical protein ACT4P7_06195 [Gemmatimonadaceae bacterium]